MRGINKITLIGNLGADPQFLEFAQGTRVTKVSIATTEVWKDKDGSYKEETSWHPLVLWGKLADLVRERGKKGSRLYVEGKLKSRHYNDADGKKKYVSEIVVDSILFL
jgi:single-strand DNA-binding protein